MHAGLCAAGTQQLMATPKQRAAAHAADRQGHATFASRVVGAVTSDGSTCSRPPSASFANDAAMLLQDGRPAADSFPAADYTPTASDKDIVTKLSNFISNYHYGDMTLQKLAENMDQALSTDEINLFQTHPSLTQYGEKGDSKLVFLLCFPGALPPHSLQHHSPLGDCKNVQASLVRAGDFVVIESSGPYRDGRRVYTKSAYDKAMQEKRQDRSLEVGFQVKRPATDPAVTEEKLERLCASIEHVLALPPLEVSTPRASPAARIPLCCPRARCILAPTHHDRPDHLSVHKSTLITALRARLSC